MKDSNKIYNELKEKLINENFVNLNPISTFEASPKADFETKFANYLAEKKENLEELKPIVNNEEKINTKEEVEKIPAESKAKPQGEGFQISYKADKTVENINSHNYDYNPSVENINNVNGEEMLKGFYCEMKNNPDLTKVEIQEKVIKNLAKDPLYYVKEGQFGVQGLGYKEQKSEESSGKTYGGSGFSDKVKESDNNWQVVKESYVSTGNPNSLASLSGQVIDKMLEEEGLSQKPQTEAALQDFETQAPMQAQPVAEKKKDHDGDGDIDSDDYLAARDKAIKKAMGKKPKKESIETKLAEIGKAGDITKMEAQLEFLTNHIAEKQERVSSINEDENLKELIDKKKMKDMQKEIKLLEKRKDKMEKMYEKMSGKSFAMPQVVGEEEKEDNE